MKCVVLVCDKEFSSALMFSIETGGNVYVDTTRDARSSHRMTSRAARQASITTIPQAHLAETYLTIRLIDSNRPFHDKVHFNNLECVQTYLLLRAGRIPKTRQGVRSLGQWQLAAVKKLYIEVMMPGQKSWR
jgi:hypothetical protein